MKLARDGWLWYGPKRYPPVVTSGWGPPWATDRLQWAA